MNDIVMARTSLFRQPASQPASQPARIRQSNNQFFPSENLVNKWKWEPNSSEQEATKYDTLCLFCFQSALGDAMEESEADPLVFSSSSKTSGSGNRTPPKRKRLSMILYVYFVFNQP
ncbi:hypothetical protein DPMN_193964 [Dreissena polymorpha]|uniref:Uncharacterized protein n=1 Tax=Dreissena polymorpha TaxID=45954 RepID=A0A9D3Y351_DREPO|nr:hypothetical protein DPMN_193964 [Dreissena polymorpha]